METQHSKSSRNVPFLIGILVVTAVMGIMFLPQVNANVMDRRGHYFKRKHSG